MRRILSPLLFETGRPPLMSWRLVAMTPLVLLVAMATSALCGRATADLLLDFVLEAHRLLQNGGR